MRLFGKVDGTIDRYDRAEWLSLPFDLAFKLDELTRRVSHAEYLGRYRLGDYVPLRVECRSLAASEANPTAAPTVTVYNSSGTVITDDVALPPWTKRDGYFQREQRLDSTYAVGRYVALVEYTATSEAFRKLLIFEVIDGGHTSGGYMGIQFHPSPRDRYVVGLTDGLTLEQRKKPSLGTYGTPAAGTAGHTMRVMNHRYLGRFRLGDYVPIAVVTRGSGTVEEGSTAAPQYTIYNASGTVVTGADDVSIEPQSKPERVGWYGTEHRLDSNFSTGSYAVVVTWAEGGDGYAQTLSFEVTDGGHASGGYVGLAERQGLPVVIAGLCENPATLELRKGPSV